MIPGILGGIGLFLLGMILMTDGLKSLAGDALRRVLGKFVGGPLSAFFSGAAVTALVQSSSATTLTTIGFVSAGLITFPQAVGVIFGANVGTTSTGWIVSMLGLKISISAAALPAVGVGALLKLLGRDRVAAAGIAIAGFGLVFIGIDTLQAGMQTFAGRFDLSQFQSATLGGRLLLVLVGLLMTVVMQSSSAAVATTLTALHTGAINLDQAAALVVGQNVGTTVTAAIATIGASVAAKRTGVAHILFNGLTGLVAFAILPLFARWVASASDNGGEVDGAVAIALFHTAFNILGVVLLLPWLRRFASLVERIVPERGPKLTQRLDPSVAKLAPVAVEAARRTLVDVAHLLVETLREWMAAPPKRDSAVLERIDVALDETRRFIGLIRSDSETESEHRRHLSTLHAMDHLSRIAAAMREGASVKHVREDTAFDESRDLLLQGLSSVEKLLDAANDPDPAIAKASDIIAGDRRMQRERMLRSTAAGELDPGKAAELLEAMRWIDRIAYHFARAVFHLSTASGNMDRHHENQTTIPVS